jgi:malate dehydrogenase (oxaloacetate-decarboxylating)(NADP+)
LTASLVKKFGMNPVMAMLSFSNFGVSETVNAQKSKEAVNYIHENYPNVVIDGEVQADFALNPELLEKEFPFSKLNGKKVNTLIFPNLESANITYKLMKELNGTESIGPILMGLAKSAHVIQLGASVDEMVNMAAIAVIDAQERQ